PPKSTAISRNCSRAASSQLFRRCSLPRGIQKLLIRRTFFRNLLHELFSRNQPLLNQEFRQCVSLRQAGDEKFLHCDWSFIWFCHCAPYLITLSARASTLGG